MSVNIRQTAVGLGYKKQAALQTASAATDIWRVGKLNANLAAVEPVTEDDSQEIGRGHEFASAVYKVAMNVSGSIEKYLTSEMAAWAFNFALGNVTHSAAGSAGHKYTAVPSAVCDGLDLPTFTVVEQLGAECGSAVLDRALPGCAIDSVSIAIGSGPGRSSAKLTVNYVGCGKVDSPSSLVLPTTPLVEHALLASSAAVTINGVDYVSGKSLISLETSVANNIRRDSGYYIGSGTDDGYAIMGRMERGDRVIGLSFAARFEAGSTELDKMMALTSGAATVQLTGAQIESGQNHTLKLTYPAVIFRSAVVGDDNGIVVVRVDCAPIYDAVDGVIKVETTTATADIG